MASSVFIGWFGGAKFTYDGSSTSVGANWLPDTDNTYDLGSSSFRWKSAYLGTSLIQGGAMALGTTSTAGVTLQNTTTAAAGAQQISPGVDWVGQGWKTNATAASQEVRFRSEVLPVQGAANPTGTWKLKSSINGGAYSELLSVTSGGQILTGDGSATSPAIAPSSGSTDGIYFTSDVVNFAINGSQVARISASVIDHFSDSAAIRLGSTQDFTLTRLAANRAQVGAGDALGLAPTAFASLPASPGEGDLACVTDSNTATWGATIAGGGANNVIAFFNGTNWTVMGA